MRRPLRGGSLDPADQMTFVLNLLNKDFSLLVADQRARIPGPATLNVSGISIHVQGTTTIDGLPKIHLNSDRGAALGVAGNKLDHSYITQFEKTISISESLAIIQKHLAGVLSPEVALKQESFQLNEGIATSFDSGQGIYFSNIYSFTPAGHSSQLYTRRTAGASLISIGSGRRVQEQAIGKEELNTFPSSVRSVDELELYLNWIDAAYKKIHKLDENTGDKFVGVLSTRDNSTFRPIGSRDFT
jgi:hypothetical protein